MHSAKPARREGKAMEENAPGRKKAGRGACQGCRGDKTCPGTEKAFPERACPPPRQENAMNHPYPDRQSP